LRPHHENLARAQYETKTTDDGHKYLALNEDGYFAVVKLMKDLPDWAGITYDRETTTGIIDRLQAVLNILEQYGAPEGEATHTKRLLNAIRDAKNDYGHIIFVGPDANSTTPYEESQHSWAIKFDLQKEVIQEMAMEPVLEQARSILKGWGYNINDPAIVVAEATAKSAVDVRFLPLASRRAHPEEV
jgi:hypothetical protein